MDSSTKVGIPNCPMKLRTGLRSRQFGLDIGIYDPETKLTYVLNPTAGLILSYLPTGKPYDEIIQNIDIAYGGKCKDINRMRYDLYLTVKFLIDQKLVEELKEPQESNIPEDVALTEKQMTSFPLGYINPRIKGYTLEELKQNYNNPKRVFLDTYNDNPPKAAFSDTWNPNDSSQQGAHFLDTWLTPGDPRGKRRSFSDTWNPNDDNPPRTKFLDTWNPNDPYGPRSVFLDTWLSPNDPNSARARFLDTWNPTAYNQPYAGFSDTWNPNNYNRPYAGFSDTWNPNDVPPARAYFSDTWNPNDNPGLRKRFLDTWNPNDIPPTGAYFSDTWNPIENPQRRSNFLDTWNPDNPPGAVFCDTWSPFTSNTKMPATGTTGDEKANVNKAAGEEDKHKNTDTDKDDKSTT